MTYYASVAVLSFSPELIKNSKDSSHWALFEEHQEEFFPSPAHQKMDSKNLSVPFVFFKIKIITHCVCMVCHETEGRSGVITDGQEPQRLKRDWNRNTYQTEVDACAQFFTTLPLSPSNLLDNQLWLVIIIVVVWKLGIHNGAIALQT